ncbi:MAG: Rrf2 family transcriptional regulator [Acidobacteriota bacterium]|nr:MAG: Rrf2 family transcriptional regulator [Acidobacteriota bacterium]
MLYSKSCEYSFRALIHIALQGDGFCMAKNIAKAENIPLYFLAKLLQDLVKFGLLHSFKGPTGGFKLAKPASEISLYDIMQLIDRENLEERCAVGLYGCSDSNPCPIHESWKELREQMLTYLKSMTVEDLARGLTDKKRKLGPSEPLPGGKKPAARRRKAPQKK